MTKDKNFTKSNTATNTSLKSNTNTNIINKSNNKVLITITNFKEKKKDNIVNISNSNSNSSNVMNTSKSKVLVQDHIKSQTNNMKIDSKTPKKDDLNFANIKKKKPIQMIQKRNIQNQK